jgi:hypothetical protein
MSTMLALSLSPAIFNDTNGIVDSPDPFIRKLPYDKAAMPVKQIDAFRMVEHQHSNSYDLEASYGNEVNWRLNVFF